MKWPVIFLFTFLSPIARADVPPSLRNLVINEINLYVVLSDEFLEITDGGRGNTQLEKIFLVFFDNYGNTYASSNLTGLQTESNGLFVIGPRQHGDLWPKNLQLEGSAAIGLYYIEDGQIPVNIELYNPIHVLLDGIVYHKPESSPGVMVQALRDFMTGDILVEPPPDDMCYSPDQKPLCDKGLSRCEPEIRKSGSYAGAPLTPGQLNQCPLPFFVLNEFRVNAQEPSSKNEFVEIRTSDKTGKVLRENLDNVILVGFSETDFPADRYTPTVNATFQLKLDGYKLRPNGYFTVGDQNYPCPDNSTDCIDLPWTIDDIFLPTGSFGIALLWGPITFPTVRSAVQLRIIDSIVYTTVNGPFPNRTADALNLKDQDILYINATTTVSGDQDISFARQGSYEISKLSDFAFATPTPDAPNVGSYLAPADVVYSVHKQLLTQCRINEIGLTVAREHALEAFIPGGSAVTVDFVEVVGPITSPPLQLTNMVAVTYSGSIVEGTPLNYSALTICDCNNVILNDQGIGVCPCPLNEEFNTTLATFVATVLLVGTPDEYVGSTAYDAVNKPYADSLVYRTSTVDPQIRSIRDLFIQNQQYEIPNPRMHAIKKLSYSLSRCYGTPSTTPNWLAAFALTYNISKNERNLCPPPVLTITQFQQNGTQMMTKLDAHGPDKGRVAAGVDLPLDQAILAAVQEGNSGTAQIVQILRFGDLKIDELCETLIAGTPEYPFAFDTTVPTAVVLYWDIPALSIGDVANTSGIIFSEVLSAAKEVPASLLPFAPDGKSIEADESGMCSLSKCENDWIYANLIDMDNCLLGQCSSCCKGGICPTTASQSSTPSTTTPPPTAESLNTSLFINELFYDYSTGHSYVEIMTTRYGNPLSGLSPPTYGYYFVLYNATMGNVTVHFPFSNLPFLQLKKKVIAFTDNPEKPNYGGDWSQLKLETGPGAICLLYNDYRTQVDVVCDCVVYTTDPRKTEGLAELEARFDSTGYAVEAKWHPEYLSISRCAPGASSSGRAFVTSNLTIGDPNECPQYPAEYCLAAKVPATDCFTDGAQISRLVFDAVVEKAANSCNCVISTANVNFADLTRALWSCNDDGNLEVRSTVWSVDENEAENFDLVMKNTITDDWQNIIVTMPGQGDITAQYRSCYYHLKPYQSNFNMLLIASVVVAVVAAVVSILAFFCICWRNCRESNLHVDSTIVPMNGRRIDKSSIDLVPAPDGLVQGGNAVPLAITNESQAHLISAERWSRPPGEHAGTLLVHPDTARPSDITDRDRS